MNKILLLIVSCLFIVSTQVFADQLKDGLDAYDNKNDALAIELLTPIAENNNAIAQYHLGLLYSNHYETQYNLETSYIWLLKAAKLGHIHSQHILANYLLNGEGVKEDVAQAITWLTKLANEDHANSQYMLAELYEQGVKVTQDYSIAMKWYKEIANDHPVAGYRIGMFYLLGKGVEQDYEAAYNWFSQAASKGSDAAYFAIGKMYEQGVWLKQSNQSAYIQYTISSTLFDKWGDAESDEQVKKERDRLAKILTPNELAEANAEIKKELDYKLNPKKV